MSAAFFPKNPNNVSKSRGNARSSLGICPLTQAKVQVIPLRYGLVDKAELDPAQEVSTPYQLSARPLGIRLLRDGWLYVIEGSTGILSEYRVLDGLSTPCSGKARRSPWISVLSRSTRRT